MINHFWRGYLAALNDVHAQHGEDCTPGCEALRAGALTLMHEIDESLPSPRPRRRPR